MKALSGPVYDVIRGGSVAYAQPELIAEWNLNRYVPVTAANSASEEEYGYDVEMFPIESIIEGNRPRKGNIKARINEATIANDYTPGAQIARYYMSDRDDIYKYWCSPYETNASGVFPTWATSPDAIAGNTTSVCAPEINYGRVVSANKIIVGFENTWATPNAFTVQVRTTAGGAWTTVATSPTIDNDGRVTLYHTGVTATTGWATTNTLANSTTASIIGIRVVVTTMKGGYDINGAATFWTNSNASGTGYTQTPTDGKNSFCNVIEISARYEENLTPFLMNVSDTFDVSEDSPIVPIGYISSNIAQLTFSNATLKFNSPQYDDMLDANVEFRLQYVYFSNDTFTPANEIGRVQQFKMYSTEPWGGQRGMEITVQLADASKFLQDVKPLPTMYENMPVEQIVWRICDQVGFTDYEVTTMNTAVPTRVPYWWTGGEKTAWELFSELAIGTQTAIYIDGRGKLQIKNKNAAYDSTKTPTWHMYGKTTSALPAGTLPDIVSLEETNEAQSNKVTVTYQKTDISEWNNGHPKLDVVWEPEGTVTLRAADLVRNLDSADSMFWIPADQAKVWPYEGIVNIEGELIKYKGKQFVYYDGNTRKTVIVNDQEEFELYDDKAFAASKVKNHFNGGFNIEERGYWNSEKRRHVVEAEGYTVRSVRDGVRRVGVAGFRHHRMLSTVSLRTNPKRFDANDMLIATRGAAGDSGWYYLGTRMRFWNDGRTHQKGGIVFNNNDTDEAGYYIDFRPTNKLRNSKERDRRNEVILYSRKPDGSQIQVSGKGTRAAIVENKWFDVDVAFRIDGDDHIVRVWLDGRQVINERISAPNKATWGGKFGMFVKGDTHAEYEYLYAISRFDVVPDDDVSFFDIADGGYRSAQWDRDWVYRWRDNDRRKRKKFGRERRKYNQMFMDEFGPIVHEVREFDVSLDPAPVTESRLYMSNVSKAVMTEYRSDPFSAHFVIANASRTNAVLNGEDATFSTGSDSSVEQVIAVIGRVVTQGEAQEVVAENTEMIRRRGLIETEVNSPWIQSEGAAKRLAEWIKDHWSLGARELEVTIFGNPLLELTDVVTVTHTEQDIENELYYIKSIRTNFNTGIETTVTLRQVV